MSMLAGMRNIQQNLNQQIQDAVQEFRAIITKAANEAAAHVLAESDLSVGAPSTSSSRGSGDKRDRSYIDGLQTRFLTFVAKNPGLRIEQINAKLGTQPKELALPIRKAIAAKLVRTTGAKRATAYTLTAAGVKAAGAGSASEKTASKKAKKASSKPAKKAASAKTATKKAASAKTSAKSAAPAKTAKPAKKSAKPKKASAKSAAKKDDAQATNHVPKTETIEATASL